MNIAKRLDLLQQAANRNRPCKITLTYADGSTEITDPCTAIDIFHDIGPFGAITKIEADLPEYEGLVGALSAVCHSVPTREIKNYE